MKRIFTFLTAIAFGSTTFGQVVFQSDLSSWAAGDPTDWMGSKTSIASSNVVEQTVGVNFGTSSASLVNDTGSHKRFTTQPVTVVPGETYEIKMWVAASMGDLRTNFYDLTNASYGSYNPYMDLATLSGGNQVMVSQTITIPAGCTSAEIILSLRNTDATTSGLGIGIILDSVSVSTLAVTYTPKTITQIQQTALPNGDSPELGNFIETSGVVTAVKSGAGYWIQDGEGAWTGVYVKDNTNTPSRGDSVTVQGQVAENFGATQIENVANYTLNPAPTVIPNPFAATTVQMQTMEEYEGVLMVVANAECTNANTSTNFGMWVVNDNPSMPNDSLLVDDDLFAYVPTVGTVYGITGIGHYSYSNRKILPRDINDIAGAVAPGNKAIYDIQYTTATNGDSPELGNVVTTSGIVTGVFQIGSAAGTFFIQDGSGAWNGIYVYESGTTVALGDSVVVTGTVMEFNSLTEIGSVTNVTIASSGNNMPAPVTVTGADYADEMYEGVLVKVLSTKNTVVTDQYGVWTLNDGANILIDDDCMPASYTSTVGNYYDVTGVRHLSFGENKIYPRDEAMDIVITGYNSLTENSSNISIYPNPATSNVTVKGVNGTVELYSISGEKVYSNVVNGTLIVDVENLSNGVYFIKVTENNVISTYKLIVE